MSDQQEQQAMLIDEALQLSVITLHRVMLRVKEPGRDQQGNPKQDLTLSIEVDKNWFTIYSTLYGDRAQEMAPYLEGIGDKGRWLLMGIQGFKPSNTRPDKYGNAKKVFFAHEIAELLGVRQAQSQDDDTPF